MQNPKMRSAPTSLSPSILFPARFTA